MNTEVLDKITDEFKERVPYLKNYNEESFNKDDYVGNVFYLGKQFEDIMGTVQTSDGPTNIHIQYLELKSAINIGIKRGNNETGTFKLSVENSPNDIKLEKKEHGGNYKNMYFTTIIESTLEKHLSFDEKVKFIDMDSEKLDEYVEKLNKVLFKMDEYCDTSFNINFP